MRHVEHHSILSKPKKANSPKVISRSQHSIKVLSVIHEGVRHSQRSISSVTPEKSCINTILTGGQETRSSSINFTPQAAGCVATKSLEYSGIQLDGRGNVRQNPMLPKVFQQITHSMESLHHPSLLDR